MRTSEGEESLLAGTAMVQELFMLVSMLDGEAITILNWYITMGLDQIK